MSSSLKVIFRLLRCDTVLYCFKSVFISVGLISSRFGPRFFLFRLNFLQQVFLIEEKQHPIRYYLTISSNLYPIECASFYMNFVNKIPVPYQSILCAPLCANFDMTSTIHFLFYEILSNSKLYASTMGKSD
mgnify:CR=1 FL=1